MRKLTGYERWNGLSVRPEGWTTYETVTIEAFVDTLYEWIMDGIDWPRVIREAQSRHIHLDHEDGDDPLGLDVTGICGECLAEAIMQYDFGGKLNWDEEPDIDRRKIPVKPAGKERILKLAQDMGVTVKKERYSGEEIPQPENYD